MTQSNIIELAPPRRRSVSQLTSYTQCGEAYRLSRVARAPERPTAWSIHGSAFHQGIEEWELSDRQLSVEAVKDAAWQYYDTHIAEALEANPDYSVWLTGGNKKGETDIADRRVVVGEQIDLYINYAEAYSDEWRIWNVGPKGKACELEFTVEFGGVQVLGYIDQIREYRDGRIVPVDLKTGSKEPGSSVQLGVYARAVESIMGILPQSGAFFFPRKKRDGTLKGDIWHDLSVWTPELLAEEFASFDYAERSQIYNANPSDFCRVCSQQDNCKIKGIPGVKEQYLGITKRADTSP